MLVSLETLDDAQLAAQIGDGGTFARNDALDELLRRHDGRLQRYLASKGFSREEREDIAAEAWTRAWQRLDRYEYREGVGFFPWLRKIADYVASEFDRKHYLSRGTVRFTPDIEDAVAAASMTDEPMDESLVHMTRQEVRKEVEDILKEGVPNDDWRIAVEAQLVDGWKTEEIMELHGWSRSKVYTTKTRALHWLRKRLLNRVGPTDIEAWLGD